jgi:hypothetical protein
MKLKLSICLLLVASVISTSSAIAHELSTYNAALGAFEDLLKVEAKKGQLPRQTDPTAAPLLDTLTDTTRYVVKAEYDSGDFPDLLRTCTRTSSMLLQYVMFAIRDDPNLESIVREQNTRAFEELMDKSFGAFQPEMGRLEIFVLLCNGKVVSLANGFSKNPLGGQALESFKKSMSLFRRSTHKVYIGSVRRALNTTLPTDYRAKLLTALNSAAPQHSSIFTPELREEVVRRLRQGDEALPNEMKAQASEIATRMASLSCEGLCSY